MLDENCLYVPGRVRGWCCVIAYNADGGHKESVDAVANSIKECALYRAVDAPQPTFAQIRTQITDRTIGTAFRDGWQGDYPSMMAFLEPLFVTGAGSNDVDDSHPAFDAALTAAEAAPALPESCALNQRRAASLVARHACRTAVGLHQRRCPTTSASSRADVTSFVSYST